MIRRVVIRRFKAFEDIGFDLPGHVVLAGPNNTGKTTILQAIAAWRLAFDTWKQLNDFQRHGGAYTRAPISRQSFSAVPLRTFHLLWRDRNYVGAMNIELQHASGWKITMEFIADSTEQIYVRPKPDVEPGVLRNASLDTVLVPAMTGLSTEEPVYQPPKLDQLLGQSKPGDVLRNLLVAASVSERAWTELQGSIRRLFGYELLPPDSSGPNILAEYSHRPGGPRLDIASAGRGLQQVLMLLAILHARRASVLLLDEPDAHLHVILQDAIYGELRAVAAKQESQLIIATHSEVIINAVDPRELLVTINKPRPLAGTGERATLVKSLGVLTHEDIMLAEEVPGVLYLEDYTDLEILRAWALTLRHKAHELLTTRLFWKKVVSQPRPGAAGISAREHHGALQLIRPDLPGLELIDGDANPGIQSTAITATGLQRLRWKRYEIESYLLHPAALSRFVVKMVGAPAQLNLDALQKHFKDKYPGEFLNDPLGDYPFLNGTKARTDLLPPALSAAGLPGFPYTRYHEIAAEMIPAEIHPEVVEKLEGIVKALRL